MKHLARAATHYAFFLPKSKADQRAKGHTQTLALRTHSGVPIGAILDEYVTLLARHGVLAPEAPLFPHTTTKAVTGKHMTGAGAAVTDIVRSSLLDLARRAAAAGVPWDLDPARYASHSLRRGGLNHAMDCGLPREARQVLGRWRGERSQDDYIVWDLAHRIAFCANM